MKKFLIIAACGALAACGSNEAEEPVEPIETTAPAGTTDTATTSQMTGTYEMTMDDGTVVRQSVNADGTYVDTDLEGNVLERGTWRQQGDQLCLDDAGPGAEECWTGGAEGADGTFEATGADGTTVTVRRVNDTAAM
ncbi:hypothetical protein K3152_04310 [Qipengyuania sp. 1NDH17]|uniref:Uncharacterized protein n=1 Tax=Qipengyuania polymorpha TaxID=2867234 RepID=A0ABS7IVG7_9SPHN|nr:hypothetical protein [Qipengyuania polymorpha]MBX7457462.1 hypothetical protein [Qipengyuania polymorpha]